MTTHQYRLDAEDAVRAKEKGHAEAQPRRKTTSTNSTALDTSRPLFHPLSWRADAITRKHGEIGSIDPLLVAWLIVASALLLVLIAEVAR